tara:strand:+ start:13537 stop:14013 length:477 start_codon:yes stop_codon:yes gene_type:complete
MDINAKIIKDCDTCCEWMALCMAQPEEGNIELKKKWQIEKNDFWGTNSDHLSGKGFEFNSELGKALDFVTIAKDDDLSGSLLVVKIGSSEFPADEDDLKASRQLIDAALSDVVGVRVIVVHHEFEVEKISLPQLRNLESQVLSSNYEKTRTSIDTVEF